MTQYEIFGYIIDVLNRLRIPYMIVGAIASIIYGKPRLTYDMDIVIDINEQNVADFLSFFNENWYVDKDMIIDAIKNRHHFNIIHIKTGNKIDFFLLRNDAHDIEEFKRKRKEKFDTKRIAYFASVEDVIIKKLDYYSRSSSEKHLEDIKGILKTYQGKINFKYIEKWTRKKNTQKIWKKIYSESKINIQR